jgi:hypothetical protein
VSGQAENRKALRLEAAEDGRLRNISGLHKRARTLLQREKMGRGIGCTNHIDTAIAGNRNDGVDSTKIAPHNRHVCGRALAGRQVVEGGRELKEEGCERWE